MARWCGIDNNHFVDKKGGTNINSFFFRIHDYLLKTMITNFGQNSMLLCILIDAGILPSIIVHSFDRDIVKFGTK